MSMTQINNGVDLLNEFRESIKDDYSIIPEDSLLRALLLASEMDKSKAKSTLKQYMEMKLRLTKMTEAEFRKSSVAKEVMDELVVKYLGVSSDGNHVLWVPIGKLNPKKLVQKGYKADILIYVFKLIEEAASEWFGNGLLPGTPLKGVILADNNEMSFFKVNNYETIQTALEASKVVELVFPLCAKFYSFNAPSIITYLKGLLKPVISATTLAKLEIMGSDKKKNLEVFKTSIPIEIIPKEYGGNGPSVLA